MGESWEKKLRPKLWKKVENLLKNCEKVKSGSQATKSCRGRRRVSQLVRVCDPFQLLLFHQLLQRVAKGRGNQLQIMSLFDPLFNRLGTTRFSSIRSGQVVDRFKDERTVTLAGHGCYFILFRNFFWAFRNYPAERRSNIYILSVAIGSDRVIAKTAVEFHRYVFTRILYDRSSRQSP